MRLSAGAASSRMGVPILPPSCASRPASRNKCATSAVVVDLPLVPVIATKGARGATRRLSRQKSSMSPMISIAAARAFFAVQCGSGWVSGTPGARTKAEKPRQSASPSSQAATSAPPASSARAVARPEPPRPNSATLRPLKPATGIISPQLQGREADHGENEGDDPEAHDDLRLGPAELLEMMMDRRHFEDALAGHLERGDLHDDRKRLDHKQAADDRQHDLVLDRDRRGAEQAAKGQRAGIAHENLRRRRIEPEKADAGADQRAADDDEVAGMRHMVDAEIAGEEQIADEIGDEAERRRADHHRHDRQPIEPIREIDRIAEGDDDESAEEQKAPAEIDDEAVDERHGQRSRARAADIDHRQTGEQRNGEFAGEPRAAGKAAIRLLRHFEIIVIEADRAEADRDEKDDPDIGAFEIGPKQSGDDETRKDHQPAHGRRALLGQKMRLRPVEPDRLSFALFQAQSRDDRRPEEEHEKQPGSRGADRAEGEIAKKIERAEQMREIGEPGE